MTKAKILIVEDERIVALDIRKSLEKMGYDVSGIVSAGDEAVKKAGEERPDLVLMDILLDGVPGGIMAAEQIRARFNIPVIYLTAHSDDETFQNAIATEPLGYILKPFEDRELKIAIESALHRHQMETRLKQTQRWFAAVLKSIGDAVIVTDKKGNISFINNAAEKLTGWKQEEALGKKMPEIVSLKEEGLKPLIFSGVERVIREGAVINLIKDQMLVVKDGKTVPVSDSLAPIRDESGEISGTVMVFRDVSESMKAEEMLRENEDRYRDLVTHSHELICTHDMEGRVLSINPAAEVAMGLPAETLLKMNIKDGLAPEYRDEFSGYLETLRQKGKAEGVMRVRTPGGQIRFWEYRNTLRKEGVKAPIVRGMARDITEQRKAFKDLSQLKQDWEDIFQAIGDLVLILDPEHTIVKANQIVLSRTGYSPEELVGRKCYEVFHGTAEPPADCPVREMLNTGNQKIAPMLVEALDGTFLVSCTPVYNGKEKIRQIIHIATDITAIQQTQEALRMSEARFREMFEKSPVGMAMVLPDGRIDTANSAFCRMLEMDVETLKNKSFRDITHPDDLAVSNKFVQGATAGEKHSDQFEKRYIRSDGEIVWALVNSILIRDQKGEPFYFISHMVDISSQKQALEVRQQLETQLQQAQKMESVGTLAGGIAHDFNNILSSIIGYAELAQDYAENGTTLHQYLKSVLAGGDRAKDLVRQILTFARQSEVEEKPVRVKYLVNESLKLLRASISSNVVFHANIKSDSHILANATQIYQVSMNLCTNAAQAMEEQGGELFVDLKDVTLDRNFVQFPPGVSPGKYLLLSVRDTGPGIGPDIMEKIFDPYFTTKPKGEGTGLGLSVVKGIVERCGGFIEINSRIGQGAAFDVYFPILEPEAKEKTEAIEKQSLPTGNERILFVDDEPTIVAIHQQMLTSLGYQVSVKTDPKTALELFAADPKAFDLVISDITMPHMTGNALAAEMLKIRPDIPVILCTGYSKRISDERAREIGVKAFLFKPVDKTQMAKTIRKVLDEAKA